ncbi:glycosyltransferase [Parahaliea aestuarii]|uniref:Glycosyltransferase n=1 Tax=Parahaliea aestuarii TaxID=1852021 RepID=A0A5C8ZNX9_9GAMM|nr:glycosyltransferase [Parahaliea aestuarii]TXS89430.1 glycosyltransferase [Parahaliea aestuarii]
METYLRDIMAALGRLGVGNHALVHQSSLGLHSETEAIATKGQALHITRVAVWLRVLFTPLSPTFPLHLRRLLKTYQPDLLHLHLPNVSAFWVLFIPAARRLGWTIHWHSDVPLSEHKTALRLFYRLYRPFETALLRGATRVITTSPSYLESSAPLAPFRNKCGVVPLGIDPTYLGEPPEAGDDHNGPALKVLAVGRLTYYKGFEFLLRAASTVEEVRVDLVGSGELAGSLQDLARELGVEERVTFHSEVSGEELQSLLGACDLVCLPSIERSEAFGLVLLEAMYFRKATVASKVPGSGMSWVVTAGETGELCEPGNADDLAGQLRNLAADRDKIRRLGLAGRKRFDQLFHIDQSAAALLAEFTGILSERNPGNV